MVKDILQQISKNFQNLSDKCSDQIYQASDLIIGSLNSGKKIMFCGNGGSAADSQHLAAELLGRYKKNRDPLAAISLTTDTSTITAIANDFSYEQIFSRQIEGIGLEGDVLYAISTSGNSQNILKAIETARKKNIKIIGLTGETGGKMKNICDILINVPAGQPYRIQEMHIAVGQIICEIIENNFFPS